MHEMWERTLALLWRRSRFTSYFFQSVRFVEEEGVGTLALTLRASGFTLFYNREFTERSGVERLIALLVHEMLHVVHNHDHRAIDSGDALLQNLAQDMVVNSYISDNEETFFSKPHMYPDDVPLLALPPGLPLIPRAYFQDHPESDPAWEDVYRWLVGRKRASAVRETDTSPAGQGMISIEGDIARASETRFSPLDNPGAERSTQRDDISGMEFTDRDGNPLPTGAHLFTEAGRARDVEAARKRALSFALRDSSCQEERVFQDLHGIITGARSTDTTSWRRRIKSIVDFSSHSLSWTYSNSRFNRRYFAGGVYAPGRTYRHRQAITVAVDVSGSMVAEPGEIEAAFGVIEDLLRKYRVFLLCVDETVFVPEKRGDVFVASGRRDRPYAYAKGDWKYIRSGVRGTTLFAPLFNGYMAHHNEMLIVITDGEIYDLDSLRKYTPTLWVVSGRRGAGFQPPFGSVVTIQASGADPFIQAPPRSYPSHAQE